LSSSDAKQTDAAATDLPPGEKPKEPSLGPACLVIAILSLAVFFAVCAFGSWIMFADQYQYAAPAITEQLIPWVEQSSLATADRESILLQLEDLLPKIRNKEMTSKQLYRLRNCLQDNPVLLWGVVQDVQSQAKKLSAEGGGGAEGMTAVELEALDRIEDRLLRAAAERKIGRMDLEIALQTCAVLAQDQSGLEVKPDLTPTQIREFMTRAEQLIKNQNIPNEPFEKTPAEAFEALVRAALELE
jgi:hypothetical protein